MGLSRGGHAERPSPIRHGVIAIMRIMNVILMVAAHVKRQRVQARA